MNTSKIRDLLEFDSKTGKLKWKVSQGARAVVGETAGCLLSIGYIQIKINGEKYYAHRLIWEMFNDAIPEDMEIDHINGIRDDNHLSNLRCVPRQVNSQNLRKAQKNNKSTEVLNVYPHRKKFQVRITVDGKTINVGTYSTLKIAEGVALRAKRKHHKGCSI